MKKTILVFGLLILSLLVLFQLSQYALFYGHQKYELIIAGIAVVFFFIGLYINKTRSSDSSQESQTIDHKKIKALELSSREYEVLQGIASGLSNKEIADKLCLSESTIKTHVSTLYMKLNVKRRTQALQYAKALEII